MLSSDCRGIEAHLTLRGNLVGFLEIRWEAWGSSPVSTGTSGTSCVASGESGLLSSFQGELRIALESLQGNRASSLVEVGNTGFL